MSKSKKKTKPLKMDLTPTPRLLQILDHVSVDPWRCVAEIVDNSLDSFSSHGIPKGKVSIAYSDGVLEISDNGSGMNFEDLEKALRAGYSSKKKSSELGLFGIGFNVACARLGRSTTVLTKTNEDARWLTATINITEMVEKQSFEIQPKYIKFEGTGNTGTIVRATLDPDNVANFERKKFRQELGIQLSKTYSYLLRESVPGLTGEVSGNPRDVEILIDGEAIKPWLPCIWSEVRSVPYKGVSTNAVKKFDKNLPDAKLCQSCGAWETNLSAKKCKNCNSDELEVEERRVWGWIGVQRHMDRLDFGISFLRNGREIMRRDQAIFTFTDPNTGETFKDYPVEWPADLGRIVGEVHCSHVEVDFTKSSFVKESPAWLGVIEIVRGNTSLQPKRAKGVNNSPLSEIFNAYRINEPGSRYLIPGNGEKAIHQATTNWAANYQKGDAEYLTDDKWYKAAQGHDTFVKGGKNSTPNNGGGVPPNPVISPINNDPKSGGKGTGTPKIQPRSETISEKMERWKSGGTYRFDLEKSILIKSAQKGYDIKVWVTFSSITNDADIEVCAIAIPISGHEIHGFVNFKHTLISEFGRNPIDLVLFEISYSIKTLSDRVVPLTAVFEEIIKSYPDEKRSEATLRSRISEIEARLRALISSIAAANPSVFWEALSAKSREKAESNAVAHDNSVVWSEAIQIGKFTEFLPLSAFIDFVEMIPSEVFDGKLFKQHYATVHANTARIRSKGYVERAISDLVQISELKGALNDYEMETTNNAISFLDDSLVK